MIHNDVNLNICFYHFQNEWVRTFGFYNTKKTHLHTLNAKINCDIKNEQII